jgi:hypothetical protein
MPPRTSLCTSYSDPDPFGARSIAAVIGRQAVALGFVDDSLTLAEKVYLARIKADSRVDTVALPHFPFAGSFPIDPKNP